jgi:hypothetical protein
MASFVDILDVLISEIESIVQSNVFPILVAPAVFWIAGKLLKNALRYCR